MEKDFWHKRWQNNEIGWHREDHHPYLVKNWVQKETSGSVFVPLCGKSRDMVWLQDQGHEIIGVELSPLAAKAFFEELGKVPNISQEEDFEVYRADDYTLYVGDFFALTPTQLTGCRNVYDRAALIALPPKLQKIYTAHLKTLLPKQSQILLITLSYGCDGISDSNEISGPPFSTPPEQVETLYGDWCKIEHLRTSKPEDFRGKQAHEHLFKLTVK